MGSVDQSLLYFALALLLVWLALSEIYGKKHLSALVGYLIPFA